MTTAPGSSSDTGRMFDDGETSTISPLLPTPDAGNFNDGQSIEAWKERGRRMKERHGAEVTMTHGTPLGMVVRLISSSEDSPVSQPAPPAGGREPQTTAGSGPSSPVSLASWDPDTFSWRMSQVSLLSTEDERFPRSWERWPTSGMTRRGRAFALPMSERVTADSGSSFLPTPMSVPDSEASHNQVSGRFREAMTRAMLATPTTGDTNPSYDHRISPGQKPRARPVPNLAAQVDELLPTPASRDHKGQDMPGRHGGVGLPTAMDALLPTPKTPTGGSEKRAGRKARGSGGEDLEASLRSLGEPTDLPSNDGSE